jgi:hypothetical protein
MQTGSSETLIGRKSGKTTYVPLWDRMEGAWLWTQGKGKEWLLAPVLFWTPAILLLENIASSVKITKIMLLGSFTSTHMYINIKHTKCFITLQEYPYNSGWFWTQKSIIHKCSCDI